MKPQITERHVTKSFQLLELLAVLEHASRNIDHAGGHEEDMPSMGRSIAFTLDLAKELASELHSMIELHSVSGVLLPTPDTEGCTTMRRVRA